MRPVVVGNPDVTFSDSSKKRMLGRATSTGVTSSRGAKVVWRFAERMHPSTPLQPRIVYQPKRVVEHASESSWRGLAERVSGLFGRQCSEFLVSLIHPTKSPVSSAAVHSIKRLIELSALVDRRLPVPQVMPTEEGSVSFAWRIGPVAQVTLEVGPAGSIAWFFRRRDTGVYEYGEADADSPIPASYVSLIRTAASL